MNHEEWMAHVIQYARHSGQNLLIYPMAWYHGPVFPSEYEPAGGFDMVVTGDRKQYSRWTTHPADWYAGLLERFAQEGLAFQGALTLMRLGSLMEKMNIDLDSIKGGADTYNNMMWNDQVQSSTKDWTPIYNARNFNTIAERIKGKGPTEPWNALSEYAYGEDRGDVRAFSHAMIDAGADLVFGSGPHVIRGIERYKNHLIAYSLGNFAGWHNFGLGGNLSLSGLLTVRIDGTGRIRGGRWLSLYVSPPGVPGVDRSNTSAHLVSSLSAGDFAHTYRLDSSGYFTGR